MTDPMATGDAAETLIESASEDEEIMSEPDTEDIARGMVKEFAKTLRQLVSMGNTHQIKITSLQARLEAIETRPEAISKSGPGSFTFAECLDQYNGLNGNVEIVIKRSRESPERRDHVESCRKRRYHVEFS